MEGSRVGPYLLTGPLGSGGMGVVYEAWDERLERRVAIKRVTPDPSGAPPDPRRRERLRREARAAARLSHPAIVQIYDVVETDEADWIVLELVEGPNLAELLRQGPLDLVRLLPLAREIAEGLAEAHGRGILHRDLKTENVVVTRSGHAKILDFGLAKRFWPAASEGADGLSRDGEILGTPRAMSPEQANGEVLDPRSDLFSLGTLLYEAVTGVSPFRAVTPVGTMHRVCTHQPPPAVELNPSVPLVLSELIGELLEKGRERRPADTQQVVTRLAALQESRGGSGTRLSGGDHALEPTVVGAAEVGPAAPPLESVGPPGGSLVLLLASARRGGHGLAPPRASLRRRGRAQVHAGARRSRNGSRGGEPPAALLRDLAGLTRIAVLTPEASSAWPPRALARLLAADEVLVPRLDCAGKVCRVSLSRLQAADGRVLWTEIFEAPVDDISLISSAVGPALRRGYAGFSRRAGASGPEIGREDWSVTCGPNGDYLGASRRPSSRRLLEEVEARGGRIRASSRPSSWRPTCRAPFFRLAGSGSVRVRGARPAWTRRGASLPAIPAAAAPGGRGRWPPSGSATPRPPWPKLERHIPGREQPGARLEASSSPSTRGRRDEALERMRARSGAAPGSPISSLWRTWSRAPGTDLGSTRAGPWAILLDRFPEDCNARSSWPSSSWARAAPKTAAPLLRRAGARRAHLPPELQQPGSRGAPGWTLRPGGGRASGRPSASSLTARRPSCC